MVATNILTPQASGTLFGFSGTQFINQGAVQLVLLCAISGLAIIPVKCDSTGRIGSVF